MTQCVKESACACVLVKKRRKDKKTIYIYIYDNMLMKISVSIDVCKENVQSVWKYTCKIVLVYLHTTIGLQYIQLYKP